VINIEYYAFSGCSSLNDLIIEDGTTTLSFGTGSGPGQVFDGCPIASLYLGRNSTYSHLPFRGITTLVSLTIGNSVTSIGNQSFYGCSGLTSVTIPNSVTSIGEGTFYGCSNLEEINSKNPTPPRVYHNNAFSGVNKTTCVVYVPTAEAVTAYKAAFAWQDFFDIRVKGTLAVEPVSDDKLSIYSNLNGITVQTQGISTVAVYTVLGQKVHQSVMDGTSEIQLKKGIYIVTVNNKSQKVIVK
jgi:hypothetical protein